MLTSLDEACHEFDHQQVRDLLLRAPAAFDPSDGICDLVWLAKQESVQADNVVTFPQHNIDLFIAKD